MISIRSYSAKLLGYIFIFIIFYFLIFLGFSLLSILLFQLDKPQSFWPIKQFQRNYYHDGARLIWQNNPDCAEIDEKLIYKPKEGRCEFNNIEFRTNLNFDSYGRNVPNRVNANIKQNGIAILGDSHSMGWGVNDNETFANILQQYTVKPVFNFSVSSYATDRELRRLIQSGMIEKIDTIVIQYCDNDLNENKENLSEAEYFQRSKFFSITRENLSIEDIKTYKSVKRKVFFALKLPLENIKSLVSPYIPESFGEHQWNFVKILKKYDKYLDGKSIFVFYVNASGINFSDFPINQEEKILSLKYVQPQLKSEHFFLIDDHLNVEGHQYLGKWLSEVLVNKL